MSEFKGTPGPWRADDNGGCKDIRSENGDGIATAFTHGWLEDDIDEANATLIAAAPELLEALQELVGHFSGFTPMEIEAKAKAQTAIKKALGKENQNV